MSQRDCEPCSAELNQYEDDWVCSLIAWLELVTCIRWVRAYSDAARPDASETHTHQGQYGAVLVDSFRPHTHKTAEKGAATSNEVCERIKNRINAEVTLTVYHYMHLPSEAGTRLRTCGDVLNRVIDAYHGISRLGENLRQRGLTLDDYGRINNRFDLVQSSYEPSASLILTLCIQRFTSFADNRIDGYILSLDCSPNDC